MDSSKNINLRPDEKALETIYHHPIIVAPHLIVCALILILDFFLMYFLFLQGWFGVALFASVILIVAFYVFRLLFLYRKNKLIITNQRVIDIEQAGFFEEFRNEYPYTEIKKAEAIIKGVFPSLFHYGNLKLTVEKELAPFELYKIAKPFHWQEIINAQIMQFKQIGLAGEYGKDILEHIMLEIEKLNKEQKEEAIRRIEQTLSEAL